MKSFNKLEIISLICVMGCFGLNCLKASSQVYDFSENAIKDRIVKHSIQQGIDPALALSLAKQESAFDRKAKSYVGAIGLFQLMPETAKELEVNPYYVNQNIKGGLTYFKKMKGKFGSTKLALAAYNAGPGAVEKYGGIPPYRETQEYVKNIMNNYKEYKKYPDPSLDEYNTKEKTQIIEISEEKFDEIEISKTKEDFSLVGFVSKIFSIFTPNA